MKNITINFFKNSGKYGIGILLSRIGSIITLPIFFHYLTFEDFGLISIFQAIQSMLIPLLSLSLSDSISRFYFDWNEEDKSKNITTIWLFSIFVSFFVCLFFLIFGKYLYNNFFQNNKYLDLWPLIILSLFLNNLSLIPLVIIRAKQEINKFNFLNLFSYALTSSSALLLIIKYSMLARGFIYANILSSVFMGIYYIFYIIKNYKIYFSIKLIINPLKYSIPLLPSAIVDNFYNTVDKYTLNRIFNLEILGIYDLANRLGSIIGSINQALKSVWVPLIFSITTKENKENSPTQYSSLSFLYVTFIASICLSFYFLSDLFLIIFYNKPDIIKVLNYLPYIIIIYFTQSITTALGRGIDISKKTYYSIIIPIFGLIIFFTLLFFVENSITLSKFLLILLFSTIARSSLQIYFSYKFFPRPYLFKKYIQLFLLLSIFILINKFFTFILIIKFFLLLLYAIVIIYLFFRNHFNSFINKKYENWNHN